MILSKPLKQTHIEAWLWPKKCLWFLEIFPYFRPSSFAFHISGHPLSAKPLNSVINWNSSNLCKMRVIDCYGIFSSTYRNTERKLNIEEESHKTILEKKKPWQKWNKNVTYKQPVNKLYPKTEKNGRYTCKSRSEQNAWQQSEQTKKKANKQKSENYIYSRSIYELVYYTY